MLTKLSYLVCFILPVSTLLFLTNGPYHFYEALLWLLPFASILLLDWLNPKLALPQENNQHSPFYDGLLYALFFLQLVNVTLMLYYVNRLSWQSTNDILISVVNLIALRFLVATSSGTSGIVVAHELIHRPQAFMQLMGRILLCSVCYEHFLITHKRGHHVNLGMPDDIATARLGENFKTYWHRVYLGYLRYAWQSEQERLSIESSLMCLLKNQVLQGLLIEFILVISIIILFGWLAAFMFLYQALAAVRILEAVNYFQHWGLEDGRFGKTYGWVTNSWLSRYLLIGLSNHIGHHQDENKRFYEVCYSEAGPKMPYGYLVMNLWIKLDNPSYQKMALRELQRYSEQTALH